MASDTDQTVDSVRIADRGIYHAGYFANTSDTVHCVEANVSAQIYRTADTVVVSEQTTGHGAYRLTLSDTVTVRDTAIGSLRVLASDTVTVGEQNIAARGPFIAADVVTVSETVLARGNYRGTAADVVHVSDFGSSIIVARTYDTITVSEQAVAKAGRFAAASDVVTVSETVSGKAHYRNLASDTVTVSESVLLRVAARALASDTVHASDLILLPLRGAAWTASTDTFAMSRYTGYGFNSVAVVGGVLFGANDSGLYRIGATTDAGSEIQASVTTGLSDAGDPAQKRVREVYFGYESTSPLNCSVTGTQRTGGEITSNYSMTARTADDPIAGRVKIGRGMKSRFLRFTVSGSNFKIAEIRAVIDSLSRKV